jgi:predicted ATPase/DNA-binding CsgD family transcriptional regulator
MSMSNENQTTAIVEGETLIYQRDGQHDQLRVGTSAWYGWLQTATLFRVRSPYGTFTVRREQSGHKRGDWYWRAYRKRGGTLHRVYVGKAEELTQERLTALASKLFGQSEEGVSHEAGLPKRDADQHPITRTEQERQAGDQEHSRLSTNGMRHLAQTGTTAESGKRTASSLLLPLSSLIGREREVAAASTLLGRQEVRLLTLTGTGGVGKTRLALQLAFDLQQDFPDGVCFVSLASLQDPNLVLPTIMQALGLQSSTGRYPLEHLQAALRQRHLLLLLDNFEQVVTAAPLLLDLLAACPGLTILVTSREILRVRGEYSFTVQSLAVPDPQHLPEHETLVRYGAIALFLERAREVHAPIEATAENAALIAEICVHLDGLPLAIELAVARLKLLPLPSLLERLEHRLAILTGGPRDLPARQHTLRDTITWSYELLSEDEQRLFRLLSVFVGGCNLDAVEQVARRLGGESTLILDEVASLLDKHLLSRAEQETHAPRLLMLETIREYGLEVTTTPGELEAARLAHAQYYLALAEEAESHLYAQGQQRWSIPLEQEYDNLRAAMKWSVERGEVGQQRREVAWRLAGTLQWFWVAYGYVREGLRFVERLLERGEGIAASVRAKALNGAGWLAIWQGEDVRAEALCQESLDLYRELHDWRGMASALYRLGLVASMRDDSPMATTLLEESVACYREVGDKIRLAYPLVSLALNLLTYTDHSESPRVLSLLEESQALYQEEHYQEGIPWSLYGLGLWHFQQGEAARAKTVFEESLARYKALRQRQYIAHPLYFLGKVSAQQGDLPTAQSYFQECLALFQEMDDQRSSAACLEGWAIVVAQQGAPLWAAQLWGAAEVLRAAGGPRALFNLPTTPGERAHDERMRAVVQVQLGEQAFAQALAEGRAMTPEQALSAQEHPMLASHLSTKTTTSARETGHQFPSPSAPNDLSEREVEVLRLVAQGLTDMQIAEILIISPRTVNAHLRSIYSKLGITSRHAATLFALKQQLI